MGQVIYLDERRTERPLPGATLRPAFFFDVCDPLSYLATDRVERLMGEVEWVPVDAGLLRTGGDGTGRPSADEQRVLRSVRNRADRWAHSLRLPLVWPDRFPAPARGAQRAAQFACELGAGGAFALAASRLAFCGGFDLDDPETLTEAAAAADLPLNECLVAAGETWRDDELRVASEALRGHGVSELPVIRMGERWLKGEAGLFAAGVLRTEPRIARRRRL